MRVKVRVAFYKAKGSFTDKLIRWWTGYDYSHVELVFPDFRWWSSSARDGGVRFKQIHPKAGRWDYVRVDIDEDFYISMRAYCNSLVGRPYGHWDILRFVLKFTPRDRKGLFCSEAVSKALILGGVLSRQIDTSRISPGKLHTVLKETIGKETTIG